MRTLWNLYFSYGKNPAETVQSLVQNRRFSVAFLGYGVAALCWVCFFWMGSNLSIWGFIWRFAFFWLLEITLGYLWASLSGLFLNFLSEGNGSSSLFFALGLSGFVQGILLCFSVLREAAPWIGPLAALVFVITLFLRFFVVVLNTARAVQIGLGKAFGALCFALVPAAAAGMLCLGAVALLISLAM